MIKNYFFYKKLFFTINKLYIKTNIYYLFNFKKQVTYEKYAPLKNVQLGNGRIAFRLVAFR